MKNLLQILGPTGTGKSSLAVTLAKYYNGEVISADSMQVYNDFNIGTAKISLDEMNGVKHYMIDILSDCSQFNVKRFLTMSHEISENIIKKNKLPIICGGTALYLKVMIKGIFHEKEKSRLSRNKLKSIGQKSGFQLLWNRLKQIDPEFAEKIGKNDKIRIVRGLEIFYNNGIIPSEIYKKSVTPFSDYRFIRIGLTDERKNIYKMIDERVDKMIRNGLIEEVIDLKKKYRRNCPPFKSLGYKEVIDFLGGKISKDACIELIKQHSRNFAKRQLTWFRNEKDIRWFKTNQVNTLKEYLDAELRS